MSHDSEATYLVGRNGENIPENIPPDPPHSLQQFINRVSEAILPVWEKLQGVMEQIGEQLETINEREKTRAYEHLVTPPVDHTTAHVTHTHTKPPRPARMYRRRTP